MKPKCLILVAGITAALTCSALGQQDDKLGKLSFPTSCDPKVQAEFERGVAMIHSYWFLIARRTFEGVLREDPNCAMAYWGIALDLLNNSLAVVPPRADAEAAWAALEKARAVGAKTQRERDWIEALSAYFRDHDKLPVNVRLAAYNNAMEQLAQRYTDDYEAQAFYALTLQASASPSGRHAFHHSRLRLPPARGKGHPCGPALCHYRASRAARPAHAVAHLLDGRTMGGIDRVKCFGTRDPA